LNKPVVGPENRLSETRANVPRRSKSIEKRARAPYATL
jgi:hypothetical protein